MSTPAGDDVAGAGRLIISLDAGDAEAEAERLGDHIERILAHAARDAGRRMQREIRQAVRAISPVTIRVEADTGPFGHTIDTLRNFDAVSIRVVPDLTGFLERIRALLAGEEVSIRVVPDLDGFDDRIRAHHAPPVTVDVNADTDRFGAALSRLGGIAGRIGGALTGLLKFGAVGIAAAGAAQSIIGLTAALAPVAGLLAAGPAVILGYQAALGTLKLALAGVSDAFGAALTGSAEEFNKSLEGLSPAAQAAAKEVRALKPAFEELRSTVQDSFFEQIEGDITRTAEALQGPLQSGLSRIAAAWGNSAQGALGYVQSAQGVSDIQSILNASGLAVEGLAQTTNKLTSGFLQAGAAVADAFGARFGSALSSAGQQFGTFLQDAAESGQAVAWVEGAIQVLSQLGAILSNVGSVLSGVFQAGNAVGAGFLNNLQNITASFAEFVNSARGQEAIGNIFATIGSIAAQLGPILAALVTQLGAIAPSLAPLFTAIGPAITGLINAIGPALQNLVPGVQAVVSGLSEAIGQISGSGAFEALGTAIGAIGMAIGPLLPVVGQLIGALVSSLAPAVTAVAAALTPVISAIASALAPVIPPLTSAITTLVTALTPLVILVGSALASAISAVAPLIASLSVFFAQLVAALAPLIAQLTAALVPVFQQLTPVISAVVAAVVPLLPVVAQLFAAVTSLASAVLKVLTPVIQFAAAVLKWLVLNAVVPVIKGIVSVISSIVGAVTSVISKVAGFVPTVVSFFTNLKSSVTGIVSGLVSSVVGFFTALPGRARSAVSSIVGALSGVFNSAKSAVVSRVTSLVSSAVSLVRELPGRARAALGGLAGALVSAGADLIRGFINGVRSQAGALVSAAKGVVKGAVDGAKSLLGISSPSKVFAEIGKFTGQGFIKGLQGTEADIKQAAEQVIGKIRDAFKGKNTRLDDRLIANIRDTTKRLTKLAADRDAVAAKIQKANELATSVTTAALSTGSLQNLAQNATGIQGITDGVDSAVSQITKFNTQVNQLAKRGLRKDLLSQIIGLGPDQGSKLASTLSGATAAQLEDLNDAQKQLAAASKKLGQDSADNLFDAGEQASKGFLAGLKAQQDDVEDLMLTIARTMAKSIRSALGIKSPSTVFRRIGAQTMDGLSLGVDRQLSRVSRSAIRAASVLADPFGPGVTAPRLAGARGFGAAAGGAAGGPVTNSTSTTRTLAPVFNINEVGDAEVTAQRIFQRLAMVGGGL